MEKFNEYMVAHGLEPVQLDHRTDAEIKEACSHPETGCGCDFPEAAA